MKNFLIYYVPARYAINGNEEVREDKKEWIKKGFV